MSDATSKDEQEIPASRETERDTEREQDRVGQQLRDAREYLGLSQEFVAEHLGVPRASVSAMETGKRKVSALELKQLAQLYKRPVAYFLGGEEAYGESQDTTVKALFRATRALTDEDRKQVLRFAQFLRQVGRPAKSLEENDAE